MQLRHMIGIYGRLIRLKNENLSGDQLFDLMDLLRFLKRKESEYEETVNAMMKGYSIEKTQGPDNAGMVYDFSKHAKQGEIAQKLNDILNKEVKFDKGIKTKFLDKKVFAEATKGMQVSDIMVLDELLLKSR